MIQSILTLIAAMATTVAMSVVLLFVPAIIELKKPQDAGPRCIPNASAQIRLSALKTALLNIEEELKLASKMRKFSSFYSKLGSLKFTLTVTLRFSIGPWLRLSGRLGFHRSSRTRNTGSCIWCIHGMFCVNP